MQFNRNYTPILIAAAVAVGLAALLMRYAAAERA